MEAFEKINLIQAKAFSDFSFPKDIEPPIDEFIRSKKKDCELSPNNPFSANSLKSLNEIERLHSLGRIPKHQSPTELLIYHNCWNYIKNQKPDSTSNFPDPTEIDRHYKLREEENDLSMVTLATALTGDMNARSIEGANSTKGIIFESDLTVWSAVLSYYLTKLSYIEHTDKIIFRPLNFDNSPQRRSGALLSDDWDDQSIPFHSRGGSGGLY